MSPNRRMWSIVAAAALLAGAVPTDVNAQQGPGAIQGKVLNAQSRAPLAGAQLIVVGTQRGTITGPDGTYRIIGVPAGTRQIRVEFVGFTSAARSVTVVPNEVTTVDFELQQSVINLEEIVVTGVAGEVSRANLPFTVDRLGEASMPVQTANAAQMITGKVPGAMVANSSGRPGTAPAILLRGATSINASGRSQDPMYIVDGVVLSSSMVDVDALDIESIEIVKGAAGASLYGSRAANGVIQITTKRGKNVANDQVRYTVRTEYGTGQLHGRFNLTQRHHFQMTEDGTKFINAANGQPCDWLDCTSLRLAGQRALPGQSANEWNTIQEQAWPGQTYDHMDRFFRDGNSMSNYVSVAGRSGGTNYMVSYNRLDEEGILPFHEGQERHVFRLNVDQSMRQDMTISASASYSRQEYDPREGGMFALTRMPAGVDLLARDPEFPDHYVLKPDPFNDNQNPLIDMAERHDMTVRGRFIGSLSGRWSPLSWFDLDGAVGFDRLDAQRENYIRKGVRNLNGTPGTGSISYNNDRVEGVNASLTANFRRQFGDLATTSQVRYLIEREDNKSADVNGSQFIAEGVYTIGNTTSTTRSGSSGMSPERRDGFFVSTDLQYDNRYILNALVRQDGSSRFGADSRRKWYYRMAGKYRLAQEDWFNVPGVDELSFRYSLGTAGNTPSWSAQYETYSVSSSGITPGVLGNKDLKPEYATEQEFGIEAMFLSRFSADLTYAKSDVKDQILNIPLPAFSGYSSQWRNAGRLKSNTIEATLTAQFRPTDNITWTSRVLFDRTRSEITELNAPAYQTGVSSQGLEDVFYVRAGEKVGTFYGFRYAQNCGHLPEGMSCDEFEVNDDGWLVWVGSAGSHRNGWQTYTAEDGSTRTYWGTTAPFTVGGYNIQWGTPFGTKGVDPISGDSTEFLPLGSTMPKYSIGWANTINWGNFQIYGLLRSVQGFKVYNQPLQWAVFQSYAGIMDESGTADEDLKKPLGYYSALYGRNGLNPSNAFIDDASFIKLQELSVSYRFSRELLDKLVLTRGFDGLRFSVTGNNLLTWSDYDGYDPDVGFGGGGLGSAVLSRVDGYGYPPYRTVKLGVELNF